MPTYHAVKQSECLSSIAKKYGFADYRSIYDHPQNAHLKEARPNPNVLSPGDRLFIPDKRLRQEPGSTEQRHAFRLLKPGTRLRIVLKSDQDQPYANKRYRLDLNDETYEGRTDGQGQLQQEIPADAASGKLTLWFDEDPEGKTYVWDLAIGGLDPVETISGVQARLNNLGAECGAVDGIIGPKTTAAVKAFQKANGLAVDGTCGPQTQAKLKELHGC